MAALRISYHLRVSAVAIARRFSYRHARAIADLISRAATLALKFELIRATDGLESLGGEMKSLIRFVLVGIITIMLYGAHPAQAQTFNLMPQPAQLEPGSGR
jgi:hypothetical protein